jgi:hypothetical protein
LVATPAATIAPISGSLRYASIIVTQVMRAAMGWR